MNRSLTMASIITIIAIGFLGFGFAFSSVAVVDIIVDGENASIKISSLPFNGKNNELLKKELHKYLFDEVKNINSNTTTLISKIKEISEEHGYNDVEVNVRSQFGENTLSMLVIVDGTSMVPTLKDGERLIIEKNKNAKVGDVVVANSAEYGLIVKRVNRTKGNELYLTSDNKNVETVIENGIVYEVSGIRTWVDRSQIVGIAKV